MLILLSSFFITWLSLFIDNISLFFVAITIFGLSTLLELARRYKIIFKIQTILDSIPGKIRNLRKDVEKGFSRVEEKQFSFKVGVVSNDKLMEMVRPFLRIGLFWSIQNYLGKNIDNYILQSGVALNPRLLAAKSTAYLALSLVIVIPLSIVLAFVINPLFMLLLLTPVFFMIYPTLVLKSLKSERKTVIDDELSFFVTYASIMQSVGYPLYGAIVEIIGKNLFTIIEREAKLLRRDVDLFAMDFLTAINNLATNHPNIAFQSILFGYVSIAKSGGDMVNYMDLKAAEFFNNMKFRMIKYSGTAATMSEALLIVQMVMPSLLISAAFIIPGDSLDLLVMTGIVLVPMITIVIIFSAHLSQPKNRDIVEHSRYAIVAGIIASTISFVMGFDMWLVISIGVISGAVINTVYTLPQFRQIAGVETALPEFMRDITEYRKIGFDVPTAVLRVAENRKYNTSFDAILSSVASKVRFGKTLEDAVESMKIRSWTGKLTLFILAKISETGGGTPATLEHVTNFITQMSVARKEMLSSVKVFAYIGYIGPILMVWIGKGSSSIMAKIGPGISFLNGGSGGISTSFSITPEFTALINLVIIVSSLCMGLAMGKISNFTLKNTIPLMISGLIGIVAIYASPYLPSFIK